MNGDLDMYKEEKGGQDARTVGTIPDLL